MAYGIDKLIAAGVPESLFSRHVEYLRAGSKGKLHSPVPVCRKRGTFQTVHADPVTVTDLDVCGHCGDYVPAEVDDALRAGEQYQKLLQLLQEPAGWLNVARLYAARCELAGRYTLVADAGRDALVADFASRVDSDIACRRANLEVNVSSWAVGAALTRTDRWARAIERSFAELNLPSYASGGPRDGAWLLGVLHPALVDNLLAGQSREQAKGAAHQAAVDAVTSRGGVADTRLDEAIEKVLNFWLRQADADLREHGDQTVTTVAFVSYQTTTLSSFWRLLAPSAPVHVGRGGHGVVAAKLPAVVAAVVSLHDGVIDLVSAPAAGDDDAVLRICAQLLDAGVPAGDVIDTARDVRLPAAS